MVKIIISILLLLTLKSSAQVDLWHMHNYTAITGTLPPLDTYTGASRGYSLRKLSTAYAGSAIRVRRSSDNTTQDIGFLPSGHLDTASMKTFVGAGNGFINYWYDQSGSGSSIGQAAYQGNPPQQPRIMNAGVIDRENGLPTIVFVPANSNLLIFPATTSTANWSVYMTGKRRIAGVRGPMVAVQGFSGGPLVAQWNDNNVYIQRTQSSGTGFYRSVADATATFILLEAYNTSNVTTAYKNATAYTLGSETGAGFTGLGFAYIGRYLESGSNFTDGNISEVIIYETSQIANRLGMEANIMTYYGL